GVCGTGRPLAALTRTGTSRSLLSGVDELMRTIFAGQAASPYPGKRSGAYCVIMATPEPPRLAPKLVPVEFERALGEIAAARFRGEILIDELPAPTRIAPHATAMSAEVTVGGIDIGSGRLVVLHDPAGEDAWEGTFRCVAYVRAEIDLEHADDNRAFLAEVGWSYLLEALAGRGAEYRAESGTVTAVNSQNFGGMADEPSSAHLEIRASWTPSGSLRPHVEAWGDLLAAASGLEPIAEGVTSIPSARQRAIRHDRG
ncbi:MAG TPA: DUF3000 domain-containing protein, partial [Marmoricola sp.]|nr:DUF3000 domain-containing protein [Marmoricola sp.]